jgi:hypothetical protein
LTAYTKAYGTRLAANATILGSFMQRVLPEGWSHGSGKLSGSHTIIDEDGEPKQVTRPNGYKLPPLEVCRKNWERIFGGAFKWNGALGTTAESSLGLHEEVF